MSRTMNSITAIVPTYNRAGFLSESLQSIVDQTRPVDEIIVWDDGSTDGTEACARSVPGPIRYFRSENGGKARALNAALRETSGNLIWICDDDDLAMPNAVEVLAGMLETESGAGVAAGSYVRFRDDADTGERAEFGPGYWPDLREGSVLRHLLEDIFLFQNATLVRRELYEMVGPFRENLARSIDYDMVVRLALHARVKVTEDALFRQRKHDGARGPAAARHAAARSDEVWKEADRAVFAPFRKTIPSSLYTGLFEGETAERAGQLQRACVYARHTDWAAAMEDFQSAASVFPDMALAPIEQAICRRAMAGKHGIAEALDPHIRRCLAELARSGPIGAQITAALARGVLWRGRAALRDGQVGETTKIGRFFLALQFANTVRRSRKLGLTVLSERQEPPLLEEKMRH